MKIEESIAQISELPISTQALLPLLVDFKRPYDKIEELVKAKHLYQLKKGLYVAGAKIKTPHPELFLMANHLYGPSYISAESALSYWGLISEKVINISSITTRKTKVFNTDLGDFYYFHVPPKGYSVGLCQVQLTSVQTVIMALPEKALCDYIIQTHGLNLRSIRQAKQFLEEDLRLDMNAFYAMKADLLAECVAQCPKSNSLVVLSKMILSYA